MPNPASEGCVTFFRCYNYHPVLLRCGPGQQFHFGKRQCMNGRDVNCTGQLQKYVDERPSPFNFQNKKTRENFLSHIMYSGTLPEFYGNIRNSSPRDHADQLPKQAVVSHEHVLADGQVITHTHPVNLTYSMKNGKIDAHVLPHTHAPTSKLRNDRNGEKVIPKDLPVSVPKQASVSHQHVLPNGRVMTHTHSVPLTYTVKGGNVVAQVLPHVHAGPSNMKTGSNGTHVLPGTIPVSAPNRRSLTHKHLLPNGTVITHAHSVPLTYAMRNGKVVAHVLPHTRERNVVEQDYTVSTPSQKRVTHQHRLANGTVITHTHSVPLAYTIKNGKVRARVQTHTHALPTLPRGLYSSVTPATTYYKPYGLTYLSYPNVLAVPQSATRRGGGWGQGGIRGRGINAAPSLYPYRVPANPLPRLIDNIDINSNDYRRRLG